MKSLRLTNRDVSIVQTVLAYRALTSQQIERLHFAPENGQTHLTKTSRCLLRLRLLHSHGYLARMEQPQTFSEGRRPYIYLLTEHGANLLASALGKERDEIDWKPAHNRLSPFTLAHWLATQDVRVGVQLSAERHDFGAEWMDEPALRKAHAGDRIELELPQQGVQKAVVVPDGYFSLGTDKGRAHFFVEIDMRTVTGQATSANHRDWQKKILAYVAWQRSGLFTNRYQAKSFRVLTVTTSERRLAHLKAVTERAGGERRFWFATFDRLKDADTLVDFVWNVATRDDRYSVTK